MQAVSSLTPRRISQVAMAGDGAGFSTSRSDRVPDASAKKEEYVEGNLQILCRIECSADADVMCVRFSPDGNHIAAGLSDGHIKIFSDSGQLEYSLLDDDLTKSKLPVTSLHFIPYTSSDKIEHTHLLFATYASGMIKFWHYTSNKCVQTINEARQTLASCFNPSATTLLTAGADPQINAYDMETKTKLRSYEPSDSRDQMNGHRCRVLAVQYHPIKENMFVSGGWDDTIQFWDDRDKKKHAIRRIYGPHICGDAIDIDPVSDHILTGSWRKDNVLQIWDFKTGNRLKNVPMDPMHSSLMYCAQWLGRDSIACGGCEQNMMRVIDRGTLNTVGQLVQLPNAVYCLDNDHSGSKQPRIVCGSSRFLYVLRVEKKP